MFRVREESKNHIDKCSFFSFQKRLGQRQGEIQRKVTTVEKGKQCDVGDVGEGGGGEGGGGGTVVEMNVVRYYN